MTITYALRQYYSNERAVSYAFIAFATLSIVVGGLLALRPRPPASGIAWPLLALGIVLAVGGGGYLRQVAAKQQRGLSLMERDPAAYQREEADSLRITATRYRIYRGVEATLLIIGVAIALHGARAARSTLMGVGLGLALEALGAFTIDSFGAYHTAIYEREVARLAATQSRPSR
jgi:hypothetical protein